MRDGESGSGLSALRGVASVVAGLGAGELVAGLVPPHASPVAAVAGSLVDLAPGWAKELGIQLLGGWDKLAIILLVAIVVAGLGAVAGLLESRRAPLGTALVAALGLVGLLAAVLRGGSWVAAVPGLVGAAVAILVFRLLVVRARTEEDAGTSRATGGGLDRRAFLSWAGGLTAGGALAALGGTAMSGLLRAGSAAAAVVRLPGPRRPAPPIPAGAELGVPGLAPVVTPVADFYRVDTAFIVPRLSPADWRLRIHGRVDRELELGWDELAALDFEEFDVTLMCVSNPVGGPLTGNARWLGTRLRPLIEEAGPHPDADMALSRSVDGWTASTPLEVLREPDRAAILAVAMNGEPLTPEHGAPVRMVVPGLYGYVSATKWVVDIELTRFDEQSAYWTRNGWAPRGPVKLQSRIDVPRGGRLTAGPTAIAGVAWHQHVGVAGVEVRVDGGPWRAAELAEAIGVDTWVQWRLDWDAAPGEHRIEVRAIGADGEVQTEELRDVVPDGATGHHRVIVQVA